MSTDPVAASLTASARLLAESVLDGGRLLVTGAGRAAADARHVVVEFLHPAIVGKRAVPARLGIDDARSGDVRLAIAYGTEPPPPCEIAISDQPSPAPAQTVPAASKQDAVVAYHVLWELTHVYLDALNPVHTADDDSGSLGDLYPMIYGRAVDLDAVDQAAVQSATAKRREIAELRARVLDECDAAIDKAAALIAAAPSVHTFGNGGSATDAADVAWAIGPRARALSDDIATVTALANDVSFDVVFARQLDVLASPGDAAVALSTSGTSRNVMAGLERAAALGVATIGLAGYDGGAMAKAGLDACLVVPSSSVHRIQEAQVTLYDEIVSRAAATAA